MKGLQRLFLYMMKALFPVNAREDKTAVIVQGSARLVLCELQREHDSLVESLRKLDDKVVSLVGWASLTLALVSSLSFKDLTQSGHVAPLIALLSGVIVFLIIIVLGISALSPKVYLQPLSTDWEEMCELYLTQDEQGATEQLVSQYCMVIDHNQDRARRKANQLLAAFVLFAVLIILLLVTITYPVWQGSLP